MACPKNCPICCPSSSLLMFLHWLITILTHFSKFLKTQNGHNFACMQKSNYLDSFIIDIEENRQSKSSTESTQCNGYSSAEERWPSSTEEEWPYPDSDDIPADQENFVFKFKSNHVLVKMFLMVIPCLKVFT